jgi:hypothetical protein
VLEGPQRTGSTESGLNLVEDEECLALVRDPAQLPQELAAEVRSSAIRRSSRRNSPRK